MNIHKQSTIKCVAVAHLVIHLGKRRGASWDNLPSFIVLSNEEWQKGLQTTFQQSSIEKKCGLMRKML